jgi:hypothetical protein
MAQAVPQPQSPVSRQDGNDQPFVGAAGWVGVVVVVTAAVSFIIHSPRYAVESSRNGRDAFSAVSAAYTLAALWKRTPSDAKAFETALTRDADFPAAARLLGLRALSIRVTPSALMDAQYPMILFLVEDPDVVVTRQFLEGRPRRAGARYVVLAEIHDNEAVILDPIAGRFAMPVPDLVENVGAFGTVWMPIP